VSQSEPDRDQIRAYLEVRTGRLSNRALVSRTQDRLAELDPPAWISELAFLGPEEVLSAHDVLERQLYRSGLLPDSEALREEIRMALARWADRVAESGVVESDGVTPTAVRLLHLVPGYFPSDVSVPIEEFPYASTVRSATDLAAYMHRHLFELVPVFVPRNRE
jgi:hypothetical protein